MGGFVGCVRACEEEEEEEKKTVTPMVCIRQATVRAISFTPAWSL